MQQEDNGSLSQHQQLHGLTTLLFWGLKDRKRIWMSLLQESLVTPINWWKSVFILCIHVLVGVGMRMKKAGRVVAINYLTQLQLDYFSLPRGWLKWRLWSWTAEWGVDMYREEVFTSATVIGIPDLCKKTQGHWHLCKGRTPAME